MLWEFHLNFQKLFQNMNQRTSINAVNNKNVNNKLKNLDEVNKFLANNFLKPTQGKKEKQNSSIITDETEKMSKISQKVFSPGFIGKFYPILGEKKKNQ